MRYQSLADELIVSLSFNSIVSWSPRNLGVSEDDFSKIAKRIFELERQGAVDVLSITREVKYGGPHANAIKFIRVHPDQ